MCVWWGWRIEVDYGIMFKICFFWRLLFHHSEVTFLGKAQCRIFARISSEMMDLAEELLPASFSACYNLPRCLVVETLFLLFSSFCFSFLSFYPGLLPASSWDSEIMTPRSLIYAFFFFKGESLFSTWGFSDGGCCHFPIDDYASRDSSALLSAACKINAVHWWVSLETFSFLSVASPSHAWKAVIINGETDGRQDSGRWSQEPYIVSFMVRPEGSLSQCFLAYLIP